MAKSASRTRGKMNIQEQVATFALFNALTKWGSLFVGALVLFLTLWFCTTWGFIGAFVTTAIVVALGVFFLRDGAAAAEAS